jgi:hypothetical protein
MPLITGSRYCQQHPDFKSMLGIQQGFGWEAVFQAFDADHSAAISIEEFAAAVKTVASLRLPSAATPVASGGESESEAIASLKEENAALQKANEEKEARIGKLRKANKARLAKAGKEAKARKEAEATAATSTPAAATAAGPSPQPPHEGGEENGTAHAAEAVAKLTAALADEQAKTNAAAAERDNHLVELEASQANAARLKEELAAATDVAAEAEAGVEVGDGCVTHGCVTVM